MNTHLITSSFLASLQRQFVFLGAIACLVALLFIAGCDDNNLPGGPREQTGGHTVQRPDVGSNPTVISSIIIVPPLLNCATSVTVMGFIPGAKIRIYEGTNVIGGDIGLDPDGVTIPVSPALASTQVITATQEFEGLESAKSSAVNVQVIFDVYPSGLPKPGFPFTYLYRCGIATIVDNLPPGGQVRVSDQANASAPMNLIASANGVTGGQYVVVSPAFQKDHLITAESQICTIISPSADAQIVQEAPATLPLPTTDPVIENATFIVVHGMVNGARVKVSRAGTVIADFGAPAGHVKVLGPSVNAGDVLEVQQELCGVTSGVTTVTVQACSALQPPVLIGPHAGDVVAQLANVVAGSRIQIYSGSQEIADGGGSSLVYTRPLVDGETLVVIQSLGSCVSSSGYSVVVGTGLNDPGVAGPCGRVLEFEYGHVNDPNKMTTDISSYFNSPGSCVPVLMNAVPLHGVVRYPDGPGPFPLVIIVHGNHIYQESSYPGYNYLLDQLASQCMIAVSIEEDFLNLCDGESNVNGEMDARGIVLLRHLQLWREWNRTPGNQFFTKVAMGSIGLSGHSRGGEAIAVAAEFNNTLHNPTDPPVGATSHNFGFGIKSLYAIAPVDRQLNATGITLTNADYYIMHGTHDGDVWNFQGQHLYNRAFPVTAPASHFKGLLWVGGANHGHWNTVWGADDGPPTISGNDQRKIGKTYMSAFFLMGLKGWTPYKYFLGGEATFSTLPPAVKRVFQYQDPQRVFINHYEEDTDPATGSLTGVMNTTSGTFENYTVYSFSDEGPPHFLWGETQGLIAGWRDAMPEIRISVDNSSIPDYRYLGMHVGQTFESTADLNTPGADKDFSVQLEFADGPGPEVNVATFGRLIYPPSGLFDTKSIQQTIRIPFVNLNKSASNRPSDVKAIILRFNRQNNGNVAVDEIQFTN